MKNIDYKIAKAEAEWYRYRYEKIGVRESIRQLCGSVKRSVKKRINCIVKNIRFRTKRTTFESTYDENKENIVVTLTSTCSRIKNIIPTLNSLAVQTRLPDIVILWLGQNVDYPKKAIKKIEAMGIKIKYCEDVGPNTKYYYAFHEYKNDLVITVDDDIIYHEEMIEELYETYSKNPDAVIARRVNKMRFDYDKNIVNYSDFVWEYKDADVPGYDLLATGVGAVLYSPKVMSRACWDNKDFLEVCPKCDDIWLKFNEIINCVKVCAVDNSKYYLDVINSSTQATSLASENVDNGKNDERIRACADYFGISEDLCERLLSE